jgi:hypothetical protein
MRELSLKEKNEQLEIRRKLLEHKREERHQARLKRKADIEEEKRVRTELQVEFSERNALAREEFQRLSKEDRKKLQEQQRTEQIERKRQRLLDRKARRQSFSSALRSFRPKAIRNHFRETAPRRKLFYYISFNSTVLYMLSYLVLFLIYQAITVIAASFFDYPVIVKYWEIYFNIGPDAWYHDSVKTIFSSGPLILFLVGIICLIIFNNLKEMPGNFKLFFLWGFLHGINMLFGALLIGTLFETGVGHVISWMYVMDTGKMMYSTISIFILVIAGLIATKSFLVSGNAYFNEMTIHHRGLFMRAQVLMPYIIGNALLFLMRQPKFMYYETFTSLVLIISLLPVMISYGTFHDLYFEEDEKKPRLEWLALGMLIVLVMFYRGLLQIGIRIGG